MKRCCLALLALLCAVPALAQDPSAAAVILSEPTAPPIAAEPPVKTHHLVTAEMVARVEALAEQRLAAEIEKKVAAETADNSPLAAPAVWAYRLNGKILMDAGGSFGMERWHCKLFKGRECFAGPVAGKKTVGVAIGAALRKLVAAPAGQKAPWNAVMWLGFVVPYSQEAGASDKFTAAMAAGMSLKF